MRWWDKVMPISFICCFRSFWWMTWSLGSVNFFYWVSPESSLHAVLKQISRKPNIATIKIIMLHCTIMMCLLEISKIPWRMNFIFAELFFEEVLFRGRIVRERLQESRLQESRGLEVSLTLPLMLCDSVQVVCLSLGLSFLLFILSSWIRQMLRNFLALSFNDSCWQALCHIHFGSFIPSPDLVQHQKQVLSKC